MEDLDAVVYSKDQKLELKKNGRAVFRVPTMEEKKSEKCSTAKTCLGSIFWLQLLEILPTCKVTIEDISKALHGKTQAFS